MCITNTNLSCNLLFICSYVNIVLTSRKTRKPTILPAQKCWKHWRNAKVIHTNQVIVQLWFDAIPILCCIRLAIEYWANENCMCWMYVYNVLYRFVSTQSPVISHVSLLRAEVKCWGSLLVLQWRSNNMSPVLLLITHKFSCYVPNTQNYKITKFKIAHSQTHSHIYTVQNNCHSNHTHKTMESLETTSIKPTTTKTSPYMLI